jgi:hypothetical protein
MNEIVEPLAFKVLGTRVRVCTENSHIIEILMANYSGMQVEREAPDIEYTISKDRALGSFFLTTKKGVTFKAEQDGEILYFFDRELTIQLQKLRPDLFFVHGAALEHAGKVCLLVGPSKSGKSVTTWALLNEGFGYLSDELAPVDPGTLEVYPYPRALWLRRRAPISNLPPSTLETTWMLCVPTENFSSVADSKPAPLSAILFIRHAPGAARPYARPVGKAEAAARILASTLNPGAHPQDGLPLAIDIARRKPCFEVITAGLAETCALIKHTLTACA